VSDFNKRSHVPELAWTEFDLNKLLGYGAVAIHTAIASLIPDYHCEYCP
jgi:hypothetical protein